MTGLAPEGCLIVGVDLKKDARKLIRAYNDVAGVTAAFTRNLFARMNRELRTDVPPGAIEHVAFYDSDRERIEIYAQARQELLERDLTLKPGEPRPEALVDAEAEREVVAQRVLAIDQEPLRIREALGVAVP